MSWLQTMAELKVHVKAFDMPEDMKSDAEEIAKSGFYLLLAAALCVGYYAVRAYAGNRSGGSHSAARMAARMAAEARAQRASAYAKAGHML